MPGSVPFRMIRWQLVFAMLLSAFAAENGALADITSVRVSTSTDDAEECASDQLMYLDSTDLELVTDSSFGCFGPQIVGMRFQQVQIPPGATIVQATLQFTVDESDSGATDLVIEGEATDDAVGFSLLVGDLSGRPVTNASVPWLGVPTWSGPGSAGASQQSPDLSSIVQEIVDRAGWSSGNALVLMVKGAGERTAESYDGFPQRAPLLEVEWDPDPSANLPPIADAGADQSLTDADGDGQETATLDGSSSNDPDGVIVSYEWKADGVVLGTTAVVTADFPLGSHTVTLTVQDDEGATDTDTTHIALTSDDPSIFNPFGLVDVSSEFELNGQGTNIDTIAFWEAPDPADTLMFVTGKNNALLEVWEYPFQNNQLSPIFFPTTINGVVVDQEDDKLHVVESGIQRVTVFSLPGLQQLYQYGQGIVGFGENSIDLLKHRNGETWAYVTDIQAVHIFNANTGALLGQFSPPGTASIETVLADDLYQIIYVPDETGSNGIFAFHPDGTPFVNQGTDEFAQGDFQSDKEGILLYTCPSDGSGDNGTGFIVVSDQRRDPLTEMEVYDRNTWEHLGTVRVLGVRNTDGIASTQAALPDYPLGVFAAVDDDTTTALVDWTTILAATGLSCEPASGNFLPVADAGPDQSLTDVDGDGQETVTLDGSSSDDPDGVIVSYEWQAGGVVLGTSAVVAADFPLGSHTVTLTVQDDEGATDADTMLVSVNQPVTTQSIRVSTGTDDAEECASDQLMYLDSTDLELVTDSSFGCFGPQIVGMRFQQVQIPPGATIVQATLQFTVDESDSGSTDLVIEGEAVDDATGFSLVLADISSRPMTDASVPWLDVPSWSGPGSAGASQQSPDLSSIVQEIVDRAGWSSGNALVLMVTGAGERTAESYDGFPQRAPLLEIEWDPDPFANLPPIADAGADQSLTDADGDGQETVTLDGSLSDDPDGVIVSYEWQADGVVLGTSAVVTADFPLGSHTVTLTVQDDEGATDTDTMLVSVNQPVTTQSIRVSTGMDDAEECVSDQSMYLDSTDLELVTDSSFGCFGPQIVGMRFQQVQIPPGATIVQATLQFTVDESDSGSTDLVIQGEATDDATGFSLFFADLSSRPVTNASVPWLDVPTWSGPGSAGALQQSPDLSSIVQEIVDRPGWSSGNALVLMVTGAGERTAESYDGFPQRAPLLEIEWLTN